MTCNGWKNSETWVTALWLSNEQESHAFLYDLANDPDKTEHEKVDELKAHIEENNPLGETASMYADLLSGALEEIDYREIIRSEKEDE